jgi:colanic acid/amylovoran biosynthesis glycosyltransferase
VSTGGGKAIVLYVVSRFPVVTETFVVNEWLALSGRFRMELAALRRSGEAPLHPESREALERVRYLDEPRLRVPAAHAVMLARRPRRYLSVLRTVLGGAARLPAARALRELVVLVQAVPLAREAAREGVAHVHAHFASHPATAAWIVHRLTGIPFSFTAHANDLFVAPSLLCRKLADATAAVAVSDYNRGLLEERCGAGRVELVHCGVDLSRFTWRDPAQRDPDVAICVASLSAKKGHAVLLDAFSRLAARRPALVLELVGDGPERERIVRLARELGLSERVRLLGALPRQEVRARLARAALFALPSIRLPSGRMEGIPVALMEAMASGVPVVSTRLSGVPELVRDGETGLLVEPGDAAGLAEAMAALIDDDELAGRLARNARQRVEDAFSLSRESARLGDLFADSIGRRPA